MGTAPYRISNTYHFQYGVQAAQPCRRRLVFGQRPAFSWGRSEILLGTWARAITVARTVGGWRGLGRRPSGRPSSTYLGTGT